MPTPAFSAAGLRPFSPQTLSLLQVLWQLSLALSAAGLFTRPSMIVASVLGFYLLGLPHNFGHTYHFDALLVITSAALACSRAGDAASLDAWLAGGRTRSLSGDYTWPIRLVWLSMSLVFLAAGVSKLRHGGINWVLSPNMSIILMRAAYHVSDADPLTNAGLWIAARPWLARTVAFAVLTIELTFISSLWSRRARALLVPAAAAMLIGIRALMGPTFGGFLITDVFWVPWDLVAQRVTAWLRLRSTHRETTPRLARSTAANSAQPPAPHVVTAQQTLQKSP